MRRLNQDCCYLQFIQNSSKDSNMQEFIKNEAKTNGRWTREEHLNFLEGLRIYGKNWKKIEQLVPTRTGSQIRSHAQKFFLKSKTSEGVECDEHWANSADNQEQHQQMTDNSKSFGEGMLKREDLSYYLVRIVEYSSARTGLDFWEALIDCKGATDTSKYCTRKNSFSNVEDEEESSSYERCPQKKVKI